MLSHLEQLVSSTAGRIRKILTGIMIYLFIISTATFACFILEEAGQVFIWSTWPAQDAGRWDLVKNGLDGIENCRKTLNIVNNTFGWLNPFAFVSYRAFGKSMTAYEAGLKARILKQDPAAYLGEKIEFEFTATQLMKDKSGIRLIGNGLVVWVDQEIKPGRFLVTGTVKIKNCRPVIFANKINRR